MLTERLITSEIRKTVVFQNHSSSLGRVGTVVLDTIYSSCALHKLAGSKVQVRDRQTGDGVKDRANSRSQGLGLRQEGVDEIIIIRIGEITALDEVVRTQESIY